MHCLTVTAPFELGTHGKRADCDLRMEYAVLQAKALVTERDAATMRSQLLLHRGQSMRRELQTLFLPTMTKSSRRSISVPLKQASPN